MHILDVVLLIGVIYAVFWFLIRSGLLKTEDPPKKEDTDPTVMVLKIIAILALLVVLYNYL